MQRPAALALDAIGAKARIAVPALEEKRGDPKRQVREAVESALERFWIRSEAGLKIER